MECSKKQELHHKPQLASLLEDLLSLLTIMEKLEEQRHWEKVLFLCFLSGFVGLFIPLCMKTPALAQAAPCPCTLPAPALHRAFR